MVLEFGIIGFNSWLCCNHIGGFLISSFQQLSLTIIVVVLGVPSVDLRQFIGKLKGFQSFIWHFKHWRSLLLPLEALGSYMNARDTLCKGWLICNLFWCSLWIIFDWCTSVLMLQTTSVGSDVLLVMSNACFDIILYIYFVFIIGCNETRSC